MSRRLPDEVASFVAAELDARADEGTRAWWTRYLKGDAEFRGVRMAEANVVARAAHERFGLAGVPVDRLLDVTDRLFAQPQSEDKLCGVLVLAEHELERLTTDDVERLGGPLGRGHLADWNSCDWYCVKVLGPFVAAAESERRASSIAAWRHADGLWQRRAAAVTFVGLVNRPPLFDGLHELVLAVCERNVTDPTRWSQTSVGWVLRELSTQAPDVVREFVAAHADRMSAEARRAATKHL